MRRMYMLYSSTSPIVFDGTQAQCFIVNLRNNINSAKVKNIAPGVLYTFIFHQDGRGGHAFVWPAECQNATDVGRAPGQTSVHNFIGDVGEVMNANAPGT